MEFVAGREHRVNFNFITTTTKWGLMVKEKRGSLVNRIFLEGTTREEENLANLTDFC